MAEETQPAKSTMDPARRNRMLIRNGSSFNAILRALKQDYVESAATSGKDTSLVYEIDKVCC